MTQNRRRMTVIALALIVLVFTSAATFAKFDAARTSAQSAVEVEQSQTVRSASSGNLKTQGETPDGQSTLELIRERGKLNCGVAGAAVAFSVTQPDGSQVGFDADYCRALAAAILGDAEAVEFVALTPLERFAAVQTGTVDVLLRNTSFTQGRDTDVKLDFGPTTYFDGQQLMGRTSQGFSAESELVDIAGAVVCTGAGSTTEKNIGEAAEVAGIEIDLRTFDDPNIIIQSFIDQTCDLVTTDGSALIAAREQIMPADQDWAIFPATPLSKEPLGPAYRQNDSQFADVVNWTVFATLIADEADVNQDNVDAALKEPPTAEIGRLLGVEGELQTSMGLDADAFYRVIKQVGNYDDIFTRHLGAVGLKREGSANALYTDGGLHYAPPAR